MDMSTLTDQELLLIIRGLHAKAHHCLEISCEMSHKSYSNRDGIKPALADIKKVKDASDNYFKLTEKIRSYRSSSNGL